MTLISFVAEEAQERKHNLANGAQSPKRGANMQGQDKRNPGIGERPAKTGFGCMNAMSALQAAKNAAKRQKVSPAQNTDSGQDSIRELQQVPKMRCGSAKDSSASFVIMQNSTLLMIFYAEDCRILPGQLTLL